MKNVTPGQALPLRESMILILQEILGRWSKRLERTKSYAGASRFFSKPE